MSFKTSLLAVRVAREIDHLTDNVEKRASWMQETAEKRAWFGGDWLSGMTAGIGNTINRNYHRAMAGPKAFMAGISNPFGSAEDKRNAALAQDQAYNSSMDAAKRQEQSALRNFGKANQIETNVGKAFGQLDDFFTNGGMQPAAPAAPASPAGTTLAGGMPEMMGPPSSAAAGPQLMGPPSSAAPPMPPPPAAASAPAAPSPSPVGSAMAGGMTAPTAAQLAQFRTGTASAYDPNSWVDRNKMLALQQGNGQWSSNQLARTNGQNWAKMAGLADWVSN